MWGNGPLRRPQQAASYRGNQYGKNKCIKWSWQRCRRLLFTKCVFSGCNRLSSRTVPLSSWSSLRTFMETDRLDDVPRRIGLLTAVSWLTFWQPELANLKMTSRLRLYSLIKSSEIHASRETEDARHAASTLHVSRVFQVIRRIKFTIYRAQKNIKMIYCSL